MPSEFELVFRVVIAALVGMAVGFERELHGQAAGIRTHGLVACGAAVFTIGGAYGFAEIARAPSVDPMRVAAQIASGIGFVGAGAILREGMSVRGLTTAASLWASAALGMAAGAAVWAPTVGGLLVILGMLAIVRPLARFVPGMGVHQRLIRLDYEKGHGTLGPVLAAVRAVGGRIADLDIDDEAGQPGYRRVELNVRVRRAEELEGLIDALQDRPEIRRAGVSGG